MERSGLETATVLKTESNLATVRINKSTSCNECGKAEAGICGKSGTGMIMTVRNTLGAVCGDTVTLGLDKQVHLKGSFLIFIMPVAVLFLCAYAGGMLSQYLDMKGLDVIAGLSGLILSIVYSLYKLHELNKSVQLKIMRVLHTEKGHSVDVCPEATDYLDAFSHGR